ncbi:hypothetical protein NCLIV_045170 [Neospora caninum Liverpool]|uniref:Phospholipase/carboxylesterase, putativ e n=1 Tax=Neospora caninum (strain Liverpool) TaxID=572307 RepID=F0VLF6_NEOCL|nr:hypothetical protein NCLIV_045170 [Neospora caninum Liverpool]CBZ54084.1 hypothetical protein NCLIV_045170 [Neospora caninum Liverpool]CEL68780.1 TPA: phospholipase/carboxylesterase, putativ e [Neospora caninum Liverpool]|eukprot:XP_003884115.1 hypothetical protein NCLIV_045170 [Neospora caninum Liverpool]
MASLQPGDGYGGDGFHRFPTVSVDGAPRPATIIFLHGLGDTAAGWADLISLLSSLPCFPSLRVILPTAPVRPVTLNGGFPAPAWTDIFSLSKDTPEDREGFLESKRRIDAILRGEIEDAHIPPERIVLAGFSQGGALAYFVGLQAPYRLGGIVALSTWTPLAQELRASDACLGKKDKEGQGQTTAEGETQETQGPRGPTPVLHCHGEQDELVLFEFGEESAALVKQQYAAACGEEVAKEAVKFRPFRGLGHSANPQELAEVRLFVESVLKPQ